MSPPFIPLKLLLSKPDWYNRIEGFDNWCMVIQAYLDACELWYVVTNNVMMTTTGNRKNTIDNAVVVVVAVI